MTLQDFREGKDAFFATNSQSPLTPEQREHFTALSYFPENPALRLEVDIEPFAEQAMVEMPTSTGDVKSYKRYGRFAFEVEGQTAELTLFSSPHGYFLLFVDSLAGSETYGAGRYLDPEQLENGKFLIDFNLAYNPYCAYNEMWNCPIPPAENRLNVPIRAGEKTFKK
ncbi:MAG TPA: DUF1684 domain-containing protein [Anaerolineales bacterium]|nr:DUF1684 domain-containing protein [Anaerolineales bacterium]HRQ93068.1 DUF1684 domain-containing protein [Anaerolineales bacterium]